MNRRPYSVGTAIFALFFQLLVAGFHIPPALALAGLQLSDTGSETSGAVKAVRSIVICTINGLRTISLDDLESSAGNDKSFPDDNSLCSICLTLSAHSLPFQPQVSLLPRRKATCHNPARDLTGNKKFHPLSRYARAPPLV